MLIPWISKAILQKCEERDTLLKSIPNKRDPVTKKYLVFYNFVFLFLLICWLVLVK